MMVRPRSAPASLSTSIISSGACSLRPGWISSGAPGDALRPAGRPQHLALVVGERPGAAHLADDAGLYAGAVHALHDVLDDLLHKLRLVALGHVRRMRRVHVERAAHHDLDAGGPGDSRQPHRIAADAHAGRLDDGAAAVLLEQVGLVDCQVHVLQAGHSLDPPEVVLPVRQRLQRHRLAVQVARARFRRPVHHVVRGHQQVVVRERHPQLARVHQPQHRLHLALDVESGHRVPPLAPPSYPCILAHLSRSVTVRLKTGAPGPESSVSTQK